MVQGTCDPSLAELVLQVLEEETGDKYFLHEPNEQPHGDATWEISVHDDVERGFIEQVWLSGRNIVFRSFRIFDLDWYMQGEYFDVVYDRLRKVIEPDLDRMNLPTVRRKYSKTLPNEMVFLGVLQQVLQGVNRANSTNLAMNSDGGVITVMFEVLADDVSSGGLAVRKVLRALKTFFRRMSRWLDEDDGKARKILGEFPAKM